MDSVIDENKRAIESYHSYFSHIRDTCLPLEKYLGIKFFGYAKIYFASRCYIYESNNHHFTEEYLRNVSHSYFIEGECLHHSDQHHIALLSNKPNKMERAEVTYINNNIWHGISFTKTHKAYVETWAFLGDISNENITLELIKNISILEKFITYYESKIAKFRNQEHRCYAKFLSFDFSLPGLDNFITKNEAVNEFLSYITADGYELKATNGFIRLTKREYECLNYLGNGATLKSIAKKLQLSPKTIEAHVSNIKLKTGIHYKVDLVDWFHSVKQI